MAALPPAEDFARRTAWVPGFFVSLVVWFGFLVLPLFLFFATPGLALVMAYTVMPWTSWAYPFSLMSLAPMFGILLTLAQIFVVSVVFGKVTQGRARVEQFVLAVALFVVVVVVMKFLGPHLGLTVPQVRM